MFCFVFWCNALLLQSTEHRNQRAAWQERVFYLVWIYGGKLEGRVYHSVQSWLQRCGVLEDEVQWLFWGQWADLHPVTPSQNLNMTRWWSEEVRDGNKVHAELSEVWQPATLLVRFIACSFHCFLHKYQVTISLQIATSARKVVISVLRSDFGRIHNTLEIAFFFFWFECIIKCMLNIPSKICFAIACFLS